MRVKMVVVAAVFCLLPVMVQADSNVALNKDVTLAGDFFVGGWSDGWNADKQTIVDGNFFSRSTQWNQGPVWWDSNYDNPQVQPDPFDLIYIDLSDIFTITSFIVQADDNDEYLVYYKNKYKNSNAWILAYHVPVIGGWGEQTRPNPSDNTERFWLNTSITATDLMIQGRGGDGLYSVSEIQAFGAAAVPEPSTLLLFGAGLISLAAIGRKKMR